MDGTPTEPSASMPAPSAIAARRGRFNHETVTFEVEGVVHRVCRYGFELWSKSGFCDMFTLPQGERTAEGSTFDNPIQLKGVANADFESLVEVMYPERPMEPPSLSKEQWIGVLKLSRQWDMPEFAGLAIKYLSALGLSSVEKVKLGKEYGVPGWLREGYEVLLAEDLSKESLAEMAPILGWETAFRILLARDEIAREKGPIPGRLIIEKRHRHCYQCYRTTGQLRVVVSEANMCAYCHQYPYNTGYYVPPIAFSSKTESAPVDPKWREEAAKKKLIEVFEDELKEADVRNADTPVITTRNDPRAECVVM